jgi:Tfp pilus assembly protein PilN
MTPIRINLLPHRQLRKARQQRLFAIFAAIVAGLGLAVVAGGQAYLSNAKAGQEARNNFPQGRVGQAGQADCRNRSVKAKDQRSAGSQESGGAVTEQSWRSRRDVR